MDKKDTPINIFLDLFKAFESLDHIILLEKLKHYGITGFAYKLMKSYITNRKQYVEIDGTKSELLNISTGVPQGSILGPLLFIIYTRIQHNICQMRPNHEYARKCIWYDLPILINNVPIEIIETVYTHSLHGFAGYIKLKTLESYQENYTIINCYICSRN